MRAAVAGMVVLAVFAGCTGAGDGADGADADSLPPLDPFPGVNETLFALHREAPQPAMAPLALVPLDAIVDGDLAVILATDGTHFAIHATGARHLFTRLYRVATNETVALLRGTTGPLREIAPFDPGEGLRLEVRAFNVQEVACAGDPGCPSERGTLVAAPAPLDVTLAPELNVTIAGPAAGRDAIDVLERDINGTVPREERNYTVSVEASRFVRGRVRFDFDASRIMNVTPVTVAQNHSTAYVPLDGAHRLIDLANLKVEDLVVRRSYEFRIDFENGTAHGPAGGSEEQRFRAEALAWTPVGDGRVEATASHDLVVSVSMEVP